MASRKRASCLLVDASCVPIAAPIAARASMVDGYGSNDSSRVHIFRWHFNLQVSLTALVASLSSGFTLHELVHRRTIHTCLMLSCLANSAFVAFRIVVHQWPDQLRAQKAAARLWAPTFASFLGMMVDEMRNNSSEPALCGWYASPMAWIAPQASLICCSTVCTALGIVHWSLGVSLVPRLVSSCAFVLSPMWSWVWPMCEADKLLSITSSASFAFGCLIGQLHDTSLRAGLAGRLEQVQREKERLGYELRIATKRNVALTYQLRTSQQGSPAPSIGGGDAPAAARDDDERGVRSGSVRSGSGNGGNGNGGSFDCGSVNGSLGPELSDLSDQALGHEARLGMRHRAAASDDYCSVTCSHSICSMDHVTLSQSMLDRLDASLDWPVGERQARSERRGSGSDTRQGGDDTRQGGDDSPSQQHAAMRASRSRASSAHSDATGALLGRNAKAVARGTRSVQSPARVQRAR